MKKIRPFHKLIFVTLVFCAGSVHAGTIESGSYILELEVPGTVVPKGEKHIERKGEIKSGGDTFTFITKDKTGNPITIHGKLVDERVLMWVTGEEKVNIMTFHYTGELSKEKVVVASGVLSAFYNHDKATEGKWRLRIIE